MAKSKLKEIRAHIPDGKVWESFLEHIKNVHGKVHGYIGMEVQNALIQYVENYSKPDVDVLNNKYQRKIQDLQNNYEIKVQKLEKKLHVSETLVKQTKSLREINQEYKVEIKSLKRENDHLRDVKGNYDSLFNDYRKLRNNYDHLQARFIKGQEELNTLERENSQLRVVVAKIEKLSFLERLFNRLPSEIKQLTNDKED